MGEFSLRSPKERTWHDFCEPQTEVVSSVPHRPAGNDIFTRQLLAQVHFYGISFLSHNVEDLVGFTKLPGKHLFPIMCVADLENNRNVDTSTDSHASHGSPSSLPSCAYIMQFYSFIILLTMQD